MDKIKVITGAQHLSWLLLQIIYFANIADIGLPNWIQNKWFYFESLIQSILNEFLYYSKFFGTFFFDTKKVFWIWFSNFESIFAKHTKWANKFDVKLNKLRTAYEARWLNANILIYTPCKLRLFYWYQFCLRNSRFIFPTCRYIKLHWNILFDWFHRFLSWNCMFLFSQFFSILGIVSRVSTIQSTDNYRLFYFYRENYRWY